MNTVFSVRKEHVYPAEVLYEDDDHIVVKVVKDLQAKADLTRPVPGGGDKHSFLTMVFVHSTLPSRVTSWLPWKK